MAEKNENRVVIIDEMKTKTVHYLFDNATNDKIKIKEVFKGTDKEIHFPFNRELGSKYKNVKQIEYIGFKGDLPRGVMKSLNRGLGLTKNLSPIIYCFDDEKFKITKLVVSKYGKDNLDLNKSELLLSAKTMDELFIVLKNLFDRQREAKDKLARDSLAKYFPQHIQPKESKYIKNSVSIVLGPLLSEASNFSESDIDTLLKALNKISESKSIVETKTVIQTKEVIEKYYFEEVIENYEKLMQQKGETKNLENKWQKFFEKHSWVFSNILSFPVILHQSQPYVGGKKMSNRGGKVSDFLVKNELTNNVALVEIKTHASQLIKKGKAYRGQDVYAVSDDLTGAINQVLNQRDALQKEFYILKGKDKENSDWEVLNSKCVVLLGCIESLKGNTGMLESFEFFRNNSKDVLVITFDELLSRIKTMENLINQEAESSTP